MRRFTQGFVFILAASLFGGCGESDAVLKMRQEHLAMQATQTQLQSEIDKVQALLSKQTENDRRREERLVTLESAWKKFEEMYSPEMRQVLEQNVAVADQSVTKLREMNDSAQKALELAAQASEEVTKLKELCLKNANEAKDANLVGTLQETVKKLEQSLNGTEARLRSQITSDVQSQTSSLRSEIQSVRSRMSSLPGGGT